jgi:hypothetical protein
MRVRVPTSSMCGGIDGAPMDRRHVKGFDSHAVFAAPHATCLTKPCELPVQEPIQRHAAAKLRFLSEHRRTAARCSPKDDK